MDTILSTSGNTPLIKLQNLFGQHHAEVCLKIERTNPAGSIKDRPAHYIIEKAETEGLLKPGGTIIESSSGNFGISCAMVAAAKGYHAIILVDPKVTPTNKALLDVYGAEVIVVHEKDDSGSYHKTRIALANKLHREIDNSFRPDQCFNSDNSEAHYRHTAPELLRQCDGQLDVLILAVSTGGQIGGFVRYFQQHSPNTWIIAIDAVGSTVFGGKAHGYLLPGMGLSWTPVNINNLAALHSVYKVPDEDAFLMCRLLAKNEGVLVGGSTGAAMNVAMKMAEILDADKRIACIASDSGERYLDTIYSDEWLQSNQLITEISVDSLRERAINLQPYSTDPADTANYKPELAIELDSPFAHQSSGV